MIISYIHRLGSFFGVQNLEFQYFWGFPDYYYFFFFFGGGGGMKILWIFCGGHHKIGLYLGIISMQFRVFS